VGLFADGPLTDRSDSIRTFDLREAVATVSFRHEGDQSVGALFKTYAIASVGDGNDPWGEFPR
jgi:hypothetical protein